MNVQYKKLVLFGAFVASVGFSLGAQDQVDAFNTDLGQARMFEIMNKGSEGLVSVNKKMKLVETRNLASDLDLPEVSQQFLCQTKLGHGFLGNAFEKLVSSKDKTNVIANRQHAVKVLQNTYVAEQFKDLLEKAALNEAIVVKFFQNKQDVLDALPKGYASQAAEKSATYQLFHQAKWAGLGLWNVFILKQLTPYSEYYYKTPEALLAQSTFKEDTIKMEKFMDFIVDPKLQKLSPQEQQVVVEKEVKKIKDIDKGKLVFNGFMQKYIDSKANYDVTDKNLADELAKVASSLAKEDLESSGRSFYEGQQKQLTDAKLENENNRLFTEKCTKYAYGAAYSFTGATVGIACYSVYKLYSKHVEGLKAYEALHAMNQLVVIAQELEALCQQHGITTQFAMSTIQDSKNLEMINTLQSYPYNTTRLFVPSWMTSTCIYYVYENDMALAPVFAAIAEIDALHAIAHKMVVPRDEKNKFCFTRFVENSKPTVATEDFWNVLVEKPVVNNILTDQNVILTGPNAGGKSTSIRAILQNIVFAQTFGIAAASSFELTQFDVVHSFINVSDDILSGKSLFATEMQRAQDILQKVKSLRTSEKYFFALDELFTGTNAVDGEICACNFINNIANYPQIQFIYATHFDKLKEIGENNESCVNYKIDAPAQDENGNFMRDSNGKLMYPYTLSFGANNISVAQAMASDAGVM